MATIAQSRASNVNCGYRTDGFVGEYIERHGCCMIEPVPRNCSVQFENICYVFFSAESTTFFIFAALHLVYVQVPK